MICENFYACTYYILLYNNIWCRTRNDGLNERGLRCTSKYILQYYTNNSNNIKKKKAIVLVRNAMCYCLSLGDVLQKGIIWAKLREPYWLLNGSWIICHFFLLLFFAGRQYGACGFFFSVFCFVFFFDNLGLLFWQVTHFIVDISGYIICLSFSVVSERVDDVVMVCSVLCAVIVWAIHFSCHIRQQYHKNSEGAHNIPLKYYGLPPCFIMQYIVHVSMCMDVRRLCTWYL